MRNLYQMRKKILIISFSIVLIALGISMCILYLKTTNASQNNAETSTLVEEANLQSEIYYIEEGYISRILPETTLRDLKNNLDEENISVYKTDGTLLQDTEFVGTGMKLTYGQKEYKLGVVGDLNGDGKIRITDFTQIKLSSVGLRAKLENEYAKAGDINNDGKVSITDVTKLNLATVNLIDIIAPASFTPEVKSTKDTIEVLGETTDSNSGVKEYWFEINNDGWVSNTDKLNNKYTFTGLNTETKYLIRMKVIDNAGNVKITKRVEVETLNEENANINIVASTEEWTNQNILVAINFNSNVAKEKKQISLDNGNTWVDYAGPITVEKNLTIKARVVNSKGEVLEEQQKEISNIDKLAPQSFEVTTSVTSTSITVRGGTEDAAASNEYGKSDIKEYEYTLTNGRWKNTYTTTDATYTFTELESGVNYQITVIAIDNAGNRTENSNLVKIVKTSDISDIGNITVTSSTNAWTKENVVIQINYPETTYEKIVSLDNGRTWNTYTGAINLNKNTIVRAALRSPSGKIGNEVIYEVKNIDKLAPQEFEANITATTNSIKVTARTLDVEATNESGTSGIAGYKFKIDGGEWTDLISNGEYTFAELTQGTEHKVIVKAIDRAGNETIASNCKASEGGSGDDDGAPIETETIDDVIAKTGEEITIKPNTTEWTNQNMTVEVIYPSVTGLQRELSIDNGVNWKLYNGFETIEKNTIVKARMKDSNGQTSTEKTLSIGNIDKLAPEEFEINTSYNKTIGRAESTPPTEVGELDNINTTRDLSIVTITATVNAEDAEATAEYGKSEVSGYSFRIDGGQWSEFSTSGEYTSNELAIASQYLVEVRVIDNAGNIREKEKQVIINENIDDMISEDDIEIITNTNEWTNQNITVKLRYIEIQGFNPEISLDEGNTWNTYSTPISVSKNLRVQARLREVKTNKVSSVVEKEITNIDKLTPTVESAKITSTNSSITVMPIGNDAEETDSYGRSGIKEYEISLKKLPDGEAIVITSVGEYTFNNLEKAVYTIGIKAIDNAGNKTWIPMEEEVTLKTIDDLIEETGEEIIITPSTMEWTNQNVTVTVTYPEIAGLEKQISVDNGYSWKTYTGVETIETNTTVKARLKDSNGQTSTEKSVLISKIDKLPPQEFDVTVETTSDTIKLIASTADAEAANGSASSGIAGYKFKIDDGDWTEIIENGEHTFTGLTEGQTYKIIAKAIDNAGNETIARNCKNGENEGLDVTPSSIPEYYGKEVTNYTEGGIKWRIFHKDDENIYLIADDYVSANKIPTSTKGTAVNTGNTNYKISFTDIVNNNDYTGSEWIINNTNPKAQKWLNKFLTEYPENTNHNMKAVAYLMDTDKWSAQFANNDMAEYAIGGPTIELFCESYKVTHPNRYIECDSVTTVGYQKKWNDDDSYVSSTGSLEGGSSATNIKGLVKDDFNSIYVKSDNGKAISMRIASPGSFISLALDEVTRNGVLCGYDYNQEAGLRPIVCLKSGYDLVKNEKTSEDEEDTYRIVDARPTYTVELNANGGIVVPAIIEGKAGETSMLPTPTKEDHEFKGWYTDEALTTEVTLVDGKYTITEATTLYAKWESLQIYAKLYNDGTDKTLVFTNTNKELSGYGALEASYNNIHNYTFSSENCPWSEKRESITKVVIAEKIIPLKTDYLFYNMINVTSIDLSNLDTSKVTNMNSMFENCNSLTSLDVSNFDTSNVTYMGSMFRECNSLTSLNVSNFDTNNVKSMGFMFANCSSLTSLDLSNFDTRNVGSMLAMFANCSSLRLLDVSNFDTSNVTSMNNMFGCCSALTSLDVSKFDTSNVTYMNHMFGGCSGLTSLDVSNFDTSKVMTMERMFEDCNHLTLLDVSKFDTSNVRSISWMFKGCNSLTSLDLSDFNTANVVEMRNMFEGCTRLNTLNLSNFNTSNVTRMSQMFDGCSNLQGLDLSNFDTRQVTDISYMFRNCSSLISLDVSSFNTSKVDYMSGLFINCSSLKTLNLSNFETSKVYCFASMFEGCSNLETLDVSNFNTVGINGVGGEYGTGMQKMFKGCTKLTELDLRSFYYPEDGYYNCYEMFYDCTRLETVKVSSIWHNADNTYLFNGSIATDVTIV